MFLWRSHKALIASCLLLALVAGGCKKKPVAAAPPPAPPPPAAPTATLSVNPTSIERGQSARLSWNTSNASEITLEPNLGSVAATGSRSVNPSQSTTYRLMAKGPGGSADATARLTVAIPPPPPPPSEAPRSPSEEELWRQSIKTIYFDYDKYEIRADQRAALEGDGRFFLAHPGLQVTIEGHCDERGSAQYNLGLGERRATVVKDFLVAIGVPASRLVTISYGKEKPVCTESGEDCWQRNRRGEFVRRGAP